MADSRQKDKSVMIGQSGKLGVSEDLTKKIVIAVDFGTTFSGIAWAQTSNPSEENIIQTWPDSYGNLEGERNDKAPTAIRYIDRGKMSIQWGFELPPESERHLWFKLGLQSGIERENLASAGRQINHRDLPLSKRTDEQLTTDYLRCLHNHAIYVIERSLLNNVFKSAAIQWIIAVPAMWSESARKITQTCAAMAGMGREEDVRMISEPEAAVIYTLRTMDSTFFQEGDTFVLCDAGGGTVDLISYRVAQLNPTLQLREASPGTGSTCGSIFLDIEFKKLLVAKLGVHDDSIFKFAMEYFENVLLALFIDRYLANERLRSKDDFEIILPTTLGTYLVIPAAADNAAANVRQGTLELLRDDMNSIFEPIIQQIVKLVLNQISSTHEDVRAVLLVGGFGQNAYLLERLQQALGDSIEVKQPPSGWTAVLRGALMKGLDEALSNRSFPTVISRCARRHYGMHSGVIYNAEDHDESKRYWHSFHGAYYISTMRWFIKKSEVVIEETPCLFKYDIYRKASEGPPVWEMKVYQNEDINNIGAPLYEDDDNKAIATLKADLGFLPIESLKRSQGHDGEMYYTIHFAIEVTYYSAETRYRLVYNDIQYDSVTVEYA